GGDGGGSNTEEGGKYAFLPAIVLVRRIPYRHVVLEAAQHAAHVLAGDGLVEVVFPCPPHGGLEQRVLVAAVEGVEGREQGQQTSSDLQAGEVATEQDYSLATGQGCLQVFQALEVGQGF